MNKKTDRIEQLRRVQSVFIRFVGLLIGSKTARHVALQSSAHSRDSITDKCCFWGACSVRLQSAPPCTRSTAKALHDGKACLESPLPSDTESTSCETNPHSVSAWAHTPHLCVRKPPPHLLSLTTRYVTIIPRESPADIGKVIRLLSYAIKGCHRSNNLKSLVKYPNKLCSVLDRNLILHYGIIADLQRISYCRYHPLQYPGQFRLR